jgi:hypothetical protein
VSGPHIQSAPPVGVGDDERWLVQAAVSAADGAELRFAIETSCVVEVVEHEAMDTLPPGCSPFVRPSCVRAARPAHARLRDRPRPLRAARGPHGGAHRRALVLAPHPRRDGHRRALRPRMRDAMVATLEHLMGCGFSTLYGYTQSDELSCSFAATRRPSGARSASTSRCSRGRPARASPSRSGATGPSTRASRQLPATRTWWTTSAGARRTPTATPSTATATGSCGARA